MARGFKTGGRQPGSLNKATADVRAAALVYAPSSLQELARLAVEAESEQARVAACKEILDRAYGKSVQTVDATVEHRSVVRLPMPAATNEEWLRDEETAH